MRASGRLTHRAANHTCALDFEVPCSSCASTAVRGGVRRDGHNYETLPRGRAGDRLRPGVE